MRKIIQNEAQCSKCCDMIYSTHTHDCKSCKCGAIAVDGGMSYIRRIGDLSACLDRSMSMESEHIDDAKEALASAIESRRNALGCTLAVIRSLRDNKLLDMDKFKG
tara:strand:+ start:42 stop:359 length:318 start_codon:yes stop_codon:yes gene_type:complete